MIIPNPRLVRLAGLTRGAILEDGDGELIVPAIIQPVATLESPMNRTVPVTGIIEDSFAIHLTSVIVGAFGSGFVGTSGTLAKGKWRLEWTCSMGFTGTTATGNASFFCLIDPDTNQARIASLPHITGRNLALSGDLEFTFQRDSFSLQLFAATTIAGDVLTQDFFVNARRLF